MERGHLVEQLAGWVRQAPLDDGFVIGLTGPWGLGKTSILNRLEHELSSEATVVWFEPWLFSDADQLVTRFFDELAAELRSSGLKRARKVGSRVAEYGAALSPAASLLTGPVGQALTAPKRLVDLQQPSASTQRRTLRESLLKRPHRIVVLVDDIDRLSEHEVREVMRLVKLVADLPGVTHVLSYDRPRVEAALGAAELGDGRAYLEKIVQASMSVPPVSRDRLRELSMGWLQEALGDRQLGHWDVTRWTSIVDGGLDRYLKTLRDGRRLANMGPAAVDLHMGEVTPMDVIALEAVRIFDPDVHEGLPSVADILVGGHDWAFTDRAAKEASDRTRLDELLTKPTSAPTRKILAELFPMAGHLLGQSRGADRDRWRAENRVASEPVLMRYLHLALGLAEVASRTVDAAIAALSDPPALKALLNAIEPDRRADLIDRVRRRVAEADDISVVESALVLLEIAPTIVMKRGFFDIEPARRVSWLVEALLETVEPKAARAEAAGDLVGRIPRLSQRLEMVMRLRRPEDGPSGEPQLDLIEPRDFAALRKRMAADACATAPEALAEESHLLWLLQTVAEVSGTKQAGAVAEHPVVLHALLERTGTAVRPLASHGVSLHILPLLELGGDRMRIALRELSEADALAPDLSAALKAELATPSRA